jgi:transcription termination factor NusB
MLTQETIQKEFTYIKALTGNSECFQGIESFPKHGNFCDIYFITSNKLITQTQVDHFNIFKQNYNEYSERIENKIESILNQAELSRLKEIQESILSFDVLEIPKENPEYDFMLVCKKSITRYLILRNNISFHVEFKNGEIKSIYRKKYIRIL